MTDKVDNNGVAALMRHVKHALSDITYTSNIGDSSVSMNFFRQYFDIYYFDINDTYHGKLKTYDLQEVDIGERFPPFEQTLVDTSLRGAGGNYVYLHHPHFVTRDIDYLYSPDGIEVYYIHKQTSRSTMRKIILNEMSKCCNICYDKVDLNRIYCHCCSFMMCSDCVNNLGRDKFCCVCKTENIFAPKLSARCKHFVMYRYLELAPLNRNYLVNKVKNKTEQQLREKFNKYNIFETSVDKETMLKKIKFRLEHLDVGSDEYKQIRESCLS